MMAQVIHTLCDWHLAKKEEETPGRPRIIPIVGLKKSYIDLCDTCHDELLGGPLAQLQALGAELGRREDESRPPVSAGGKSKQPKLPLGEDGKIPCPIKGCTWSALKRGSFRYHFAEQHNISLAVWEGRNGKSVEGHTINEYCDDEGCEAGFTTPQGKGAHMSREHGYTGVS